MTYVGHFRPVVEAFTMPVAPNTVWHWSVWLLFCMSVKSICPNITLYRFVIFAHIIRYYTTYWVTYLQNRYCCALRHVKGKGLDHHIGFRLITDFYSPSNLAKGYQAVQTTQQERRPMSAVAATPWQHASAGRMNCLQRGGSGSAAALPGAVRAGCRSGRRQWSSWAGDGMQEAPSPASGP